MLLLAATHFEFTSVISQRPARSSSFLKRLCIVSRVLLARDPASRDPRIELGIGCKLVQQQLDILAVLIALFQALVARCLSRRW